MTDNVIKSTDVNASAKKPAKKAPAKKAATKKVDVETVEIENTEKDNTNSVKPGFTVVIFETGSSYTSNGIRFTRDNYIQEVPNEDAAMLLSLDNFRLPNPFELEDYLNSREI